MSEQRLVDLETKFSHLDLSLEELQKTVHEQHLTIERLEKSLKLLNDRFQNSSTRAGDIGPGDEKPPHY